MNKNIIITLIVFLFVILAGGTYFYSQFKPSLQPLPTPIPTGQPILGGDRDEHGCIGSAGYSWCEAKSKCIRIWEEDCNSWQAIQKALAEKEKQPISETFIRVNHENAEYASGGVSFGAKDAPGGVFLAAKINNNWKIVFAGNGSINCSEIKKLYEFPPEMLQGFCD